MRLGVLAADGTVDITGTITGGGGGTGSGITTYGLDVNGNTLACPPGYPYDPGVMDCIGNNPADTAALEAQAQMDACTSGGGSWNLGTNSCVPGPSGILTPGPSPAPSQLIAGIPNMALYIAGGVVLFALLKGRR